MEQEHDILKISGLEQLCYELRADATALRITYNTLSENDHGEYSEDALLDTFHSKGASGKGVGVPYFCEKSSK